MRKRNKSVAAPREDLQAAISRVWPKGVMEMLFDPNESYFWDVYPKLGTSIQRLKGAQLLHEIEPEGRPVWYDESDPDEDPPDEPGASRSYHLFFVCPKGDISDYTISTEKRAGLDEDGPFGTVNGSGREGWSVSVSLLAPFAVIALSAMETYEDGSTIEPSMEPVIFNESGERIDPESHFKELRSEEALQVFLDLRARISDLLSKNGIAVLPEEEWRKPVPGLRADAGILLEVPGGPVRVLDALFFEAL